MEVLYFHEIVHAPVEAKSSYYAATNTSVLCPVI